MLNIRKISRIEYVETKIRNIKEIMDYLEILSKYTDKTITYCKLYDEEQVLRYFEIDVEKLEEAYTKYKKDEYETIDEIEKLLKISNELNDNWLIVDCN